MSLLACVSSAVLLAGCGGGSGDTAGTTDTSAVAADSASADVFAARRKKVSTTTTTTTTTTDPTTTTTTTTDPTTTTTPTTTTPTGTVLSVGPGKQYTLPCQALKAAPDGATIEIEGSATYTGDVCAFYGNNLTIRGVNGRPKIDAAGLGAGGKGTWVVGGKNTVVENVEMYGAKVADRNGAAIRLDGQHLTVRGSYFHNNEDGILTSNDGISDIVVEYTEFGANGYGDGQSHNIYVGSVNSLQFRYNYSHDAKVGHNLKSRAKTNLVAYNRFSSSGLGQPSYEIDLPNAGTSYIIGNVIQQPAQNQNPNLVAYGAEGATNPGKDLYLINNTFLNDGSSGTFVMIGSTVTTPALIQNNVFAGTGAVTNQASAIKQSNYAAANPAFVDRANYDLRPAAGAPFINAGTQPGTAPSGLTLAPVMEYLHLGSGQARPLVGTIDIGAYEAR
ncbi:hypothetical protein [Lacisediminimonas profundi]|uniref:hypothetical protein n=1 Tax=Lacisediminimonas profundi TaxID=2603856 RepID=UPI001F4FDA23|nr:hypothetical protein [Lacisediminimonas profundi]